MPSIHPSEQPPLGWLVPCLAVTDLDASLDWYGRLGFERVGGEPAAGWAVLRSRAIELHLFAKHIPSDMLNFRGGDADGVRARLAEHGIEITREQGPTSFISTDPDGREVFFDYGEPEITQFQSGQPLSVPLPEGARLDDGDAIDLGTATFCCHCASLAETRRFYEALGFELAGGQPEQGWAILARPDHRPTDGTRSRVWSLSLFEGMLPRDMLNVRGGDVGAIATILAERGVDTSDGVQIGEDGGESLTVTDPDGRPFYLDTTPPERLYEDA